MTEILAGVDVPRAACVAKKEIQDRELSPRASEGAHIERKRNRSTIMPKKEKSLPKLPMSVDEATCLANEEGLRLILAPGTMTGFKGVCMPGRETDKTPFQARRTYPPDDYTVTILGKFSGAAEAALCYARDLGLEGCEIAGDAGPLGAAYPAGGGERPLDTSVTSPPLIHDM